MSKSNELEKICEALELESGYGPWLGFVREQAEALRKIIGGDRKTRCGLCDKVFVAKTIPSGYCKKCIEEEGG